MGKLAGYLLVSAAILLLTPGAHALGSFVSFETGQVRPLALSPDGTRLFAVNTPDNRLEIYAISASSVVHLESVAVGLEPCAVAVRADGEVWVVNHLSDSVSIVDTTSTPARVVRTLLVGDEPRDIVFAGPQEGGGSGPFTRAFITTAHRGQNSPFDPELTTAGVGRADVWVFDATNLGSDFGGDELTILTLFADTPRALAATPDGSTVYAGVFHGGNQTTAVNEGTTCDGGASAGTCSGDGITSPGGLPGGLIPGGLPAPNDNHVGTLGPETGIIVGINPQTGLWEDELGRNWNNAVRFDLPDLDVFEIDALANPPVEASSFAGVGTILFNMAVNPVSGKVYVTNTDANNRVRFEGEGVYASGFKPLGEPASVRGQLHEARVTVLDGANVLPRHLNKHIDYSAIPQPGSTKERSLATPVDLAVTSDGTTLYVAAFGSGEIGVFDTATLEADTFSPDAATHIPVSGGGPSGVVIDEANQRLYVSTRFDNGLSVVDLSGGPVGTEVAHFALHNPEPPQVVSGRPVLYDAKLTSSNGEASCSACHVFADFDSLAWDLGDPDGDVANNPNPFINFVTGTPFHPNKGPMTTQSLRGLAHLGPMHWRGDRTGGNDVPPGDPLDEVAAFNAFNVAFPGLIGRDEGELPAATMQAFTDFILEVTYPPNPIRPLDNTPSSDGQLGETFYFNQITDGGTTCNGCHELDPATGAFGGAGASSFEGETQEFKIAHLRNLYQKVGMFGMPDTGVIGGGDHQHKGDQVRGFGFLHDGAIDTVFRFVSANVFNFPGGDVQRRQVEQFMMEFPSTLAPIVGQQVTLASSADTDAVARINLMIARAGTAFALVDHPGANECDLVVKGTVNGEARGALFDPGSGDFISDRIADPPVPVAFVLGLTDTAGQEATFTCTPPGSGERVGIDRDEDGIRDGDDNCPGAANPGQQDADSDGIGDACEVKACSDGIDNDGDGTFDLLDPQCTGPNDGAEACGIGFELAILLPIWARLRRRAVAQRAVRR